MLRLMSPEAVIAEPTTHVEPTSSVAPVNVQQAKWAIGALRLMINVVGARSIVGLVLSQAKNELVSMAASAELAAAKPAPAPLRRAA